MLSEQEWHHLAGLADGEAWIGVQIQKGSRYTTGFHVTPTFQISLGGRDSSYLLYLQKQLGGTITNNPLSGHAWRVRSKAGVRFILDNIKDKVKLNSTKERIRLVIKILDENPRYTPSDSHTLKILVERLRSFSKRTKNNRRHWI